MAVALTRPLDVGTDLPRRAATVDRRAVDTRRSKTTATASAVKSELYVSERIASSAPSGCSPFGEEPTNRRINTISAYSPGATQMNNRCNGGRKRARRTLTTSSSSVSATPPGLHRRSSSGIPMPVGSLLFPSACPSWVRPFRICGPAPPR